MPEWMKDWRWWIVILCLIGTIASCYSAYKLYNSNLSPISVPQKKR